MDIDEKLKEEQLEYYKRENELREATLKRQAEVEESTKAFAKALLIIFTAILVMIPLSLIGTIIIELIKDLLFH